MKKEPEKGPGTQGGGGTDTGFASALAPLVAGMTATHASLLDWVHGRGVVPLLKVFAAEAEGLAGPKGQHQAARTHHHWATTATELTFGGRRIQVARPQVRSTDRQEAQLPSVEAWRQRDPLAARVLDQILLGVSTARVCRVVDINALHALAPLPRAPAITPPAPHTAAPLEPQAQRDEDASHRSKEVMGRRVELSCVLPPISRPKGDGRGRRR